MVQGKVFIPLRRPDGGIETEVTPVVMKTVEVIEG